jgi:hypothetical protein
MAASEGYVDEDLPSQIEQLDELSQKLRRNMVNELIDNRDKFTKLKSKVEELTNA